MSLYFTAVLFLITSLVLLIGVLVVLMIRPGTGLRINLKTFFCSTTIIIMVISMPMKSYVYFVINKFNDLEHFWLLYGIAVYSLAALIFATLKMKNGEKISATIIVSHVSKIILFSISLFYFNYYFGNELLELIWYIDILSTCALFYILDTDYQVLEGSKNNTRRPILINAADRYTEAGSSSNSASNPVVRRGLDYDSSERNSEYNNSREIPRQSIMEFDKHSNREISEYLSDYKSRSNELRDNMAGCITDLKEKHNDAVSISRRLGFRPTYVNDGLNLCKEQEMKALETFSENNPIPNTGNVREVLNLKRQILETQRRIGVLKYMTEINTGSMTPSIKNEAELLIQASDNDAAVGQSLIHNNDVNYYNKLRAEKELARRDSSVNNS